MEKKDEISIFVERMKQLDIEVKLGVNYPWVYLDWINGERVTETFQANHGFTIAFLPIRLDDDKIKFTDIGKIFKLIRKYTGRMKPIEGAKIVAYGQEVKIAQVVIIGKKKRVYLEHPIVVPGIEYTRDYISPEEIQRYLEF